MVTTIQLEESTKRMLDKLKFHHRESYNELLRRLAIKFAKYSKEDRESLTETVEILSDAQTMRDIAQALEEYEKGKGTTLAEFKKEIGL
ncbi:MAG: hypothetical protein KJ600_02715 [Nanoarchaeota archaeon]|nr:hypothetical protein [Nanoarchaeota archaeon]MBU1103442.1 hypothetical protein [Nanoarchaeota archaeon]